VNPRTEHQRRASLQVLDVREADERAAGRIGGARRIPLLQLPPRLAELDRDRPVVAVYRSGNRIGTVANDLTRAGLSAHHMDGGKLRWAREGRPRRLTVRCPLLLTATAGVASPPRPRSSASCHPRP
jgi:rhodanese-related sulfurtransferase